MKITRNHFESAPLHINMNNKNECLEKLGKDVCFKLKIKFTLNSF